MLPYAKIANQAPFQTEEMQTAQDAQMVNTPLNLEEDTTAQNVQQIQGPVKITRNACAIPDTFQIHQTRKSARHVSLAHTRMFLVMKNAKSVWQERRVI
tara:strand:+ start:985 stop:1281 length:297 start_codon:yes stop_codon:yes gene_type:complete